jgi:DNA-binding transcriptional regulator YiaG
MESLVIDACWVPKILHYEKESVQADAIKLGKALCAKIFSMCFGSVWLPSHNGKPSGIVESPGAEPSRFEDIHMVVCFLHRPYRHLKLHRLVRALKEKDDDIFFKNNRVLIETKLKKWHETAMKKLRSISEEIEENSSVAKVLSRRESQQNIEEDLFDDEEIEDARDEVAPLSKLDSELQIYLNLSKDTYIEWRKGKKAPEHNIESYFFRTFWLDHRFHMPLLSRIARKVGTVSYF